MAPPDFDKDVRAPLWHAIYDAFGEEYYDHATGDSGWHDEYWELEKRIVRRLGLWKLAEHLNAGSAIREFIKTATKDEIIGVIDETMTLFSEIRLDNPEAFIKKLEALRKSAEETAVTPSIEGDEERWYDVAQVCLNGHIINRQAKTHPEANTKYCKDCGAEAITECRECGKSIRGYKHIKGRSYTDDSPPPRFCHDCGRPYPWTQAAIGAAEALIAELEGVSDAEKTFLSSSIDDIIRDTPRTQPAVVRIKKLLPKMGKDAGEALRRLFVDVASETAKKLLTPSP